MQTLEDTITKMRKEKEEMKAMITDNNTCLQQHYRVMQALGVCIMALENIEALKLSTISGGKAALLFLRQDH